MKKRSSAAPLIVVLALTAAVAAGLAAYFRFTPPAGEAASGSADASAPVTDGSGDAAGLWQLAPLSDSDSTAVISTAEGDITIKLSRAAAAEIFMDMAGEYGGYTRFIRSVPDMYVQICPPGPVSAEYEDTGLLCLRGAVGLVCNDGGVTGGIFIVTAPEKLSAMSSAYITENGFSDEAAAAYREHGGVPELDGRHLVFGQVVSGWGPLSRISAGENSGIAEGWELVSPVEITGIAIERRP